MTRFLNDIDLTYIPAIKDISVYSDLVERLYGAATQSKAMVEAINSFVDQIGSANEQLTQNLQSLFQAKSKLSAPTELSQLFRNLDFAHGDEGHSLIRQKGDGIKARHIPEILRSINDGEQRSKFYLWGFEEPENSLDLSAATQEAARFAEIASREDTQVFLSSHSPAFYLAEAENCDIKRLFISKQQKFEKSIVPENAARDVGSLDDAEVVMEHAGLLHLPFVIRSLREFPKQIEELSSEKEALEAQLSSLSEPTIFVEGKHDLSILRSRLVNDSAVRLREIGGTPSTIPSLLRAISNEGKLQLGERALIIFDNDPSGRKACKSISGLSQADWAQITEITPQLSLMCLPYRSCPYFEIFMKSSELSENDIIFEGEFLLNVEAVAQALSKKDFDQSRIHEYYYRKGQNAFLQMQSFEPGTPNWLFSRTVPDGLKREVIDEALDKGETPALDHLCGTIREFVA